MRIAFIGLGAMGTPMAHNLLKAGHTLTVYNRTVSRAEELRAAGATVAASPAEAGQGAEVIITMLTDANAVEATLFGPDGATQGAAPGTIVIDMSTVSPADSRRFAAQVEAQGLRWLDSPVSGSLGAARDAQLIALVGGAAETYAAARPVLAAMCKATHHIGPTGAGSTIKLAWNMMVGVQVLVLAEATHLAEAGGLDRATFLQLTAEGPVGSPIVKMKAPSLATEEFTSMFALKLMKKDMGLAVQQGAAVGVPLPTAAAALQSYVAALSAGLGDLDFAAVFQVLHGA